MSKFAYKFSNLYGAVYRHGNVAFTDDGNCVISPVGNRLTHFDLKNNRSFTFPFENRKNIYCFTISPNGLILIAVDEDGRALLVNLHQKVILQHFNFRNKVYDIKYSPDGKYVAVTHGRHVQVWYAPGQSKDFASFSLYRSYPGQYDDTLCLDWSDDSRFFAVGSRDMSCRVFSVRPIPGFHHVTLAAHRSAVIRCFFQQTSLSLYTVAKDGAVCVWECTMTLEDMNTHIRESKQKRRRRTRKKRSDVESGVESEGTVIEGVVGEDEEDNQEEVDEDVMERGEENEGEGWEDEKEGEPGTEDEEKEGEGAGDKDDQNGSSDNESENERDKVIMKIETGLAGETGGARKSGNICGWSLKKKYLYPHDYGRVTCSTIHKQSQLLISGFTSGIFALYEMPDFNPIHTLSISQHRVTSVAVNKTGEWLAFGCNSLGQLLVWEWQSETYILKQQGHFYDINTLSYSPDGQTIATGGDDGKVKLWDTGTGFCFVTFTEHVAPISSILFSTTDKVLVSASFDGTVRAYDRHRYRNFRTFASPRPVQFSCLTLDPSGEVVCAGSHDTFELYVWSMQTGRLLELLTGHESPVSSVSFSPCRAILMSGSWDKTVRLWDVFESKGATETLYLTSDVLTIVCRPDGEQVAVSSLDAQITFWDINSATQVASIEGRYDLEVGRRASDKVTAKALSSGVYFTCLCYTSDGLNILAGGRSKYVCLYNITRQVLLKKFQVSRNHSFDGMQPFLNGKYMTEAGAIEVISDEEEEGADIKLPGVRQGDLCSRKTRPEIRVKSLQFSPTGQSWAAVTTEGLIVYTLDTRLIFDPYDLSEEVTPQGIRQAIAERKFSTALAMSFRLNDTDLISKAVEAIPTSDIQLIVQSFPSVYLERFLDFLSEKIDDSPHIQFYIQWCTQLLVQHGALLKKQSMSLMASIKNLQKSITQKQTDLQRMADHNKYMLSYVIEQAQLSKAEDITTAT